MHRVTIAKDGYTWHADNSATQINCTLPHSKAAKENVQKQRPKRMLNKCAMQSNRIANSECKTARVDVQASDLCENACGNM
jgi:hypothetical protein